MKKDYKYKTYKDLMEDMSWGDAVIMAVLAIAFIVTIWLSAPAV